MTDTVMPLPTPRDSHPNNAVVSGTLFSVPASSKNADEAVATLNLLLNDPDAIAALGMTRGTPGTVVARQIMTATLDDADPLKAVVAFDDAVASGEVGKIWPFPAGSSDATALFTRIAQQVAFAQLTPKDGAQAFFDQLPGVMNR
jgi:multiple sugar transport system substrate-binding protein